MCQHHQSKIPSVRAMARLHAADHDWHYTFDMLMHLNGWCFDLAETYVRECRAEMRRLGKKPITRGSSDPDRNPFCS